MDFRNRLVGQIERRMRSGAWHGAPWRRLAWARARLAGVWLGSCLALGWVVGTATQLQQARLLAAWVYGGGVVFGVLWLLALAGMARHSVLRRPWERWVRPVWRPPLRQLGCVLAAVMLAWGSTGWRAQQQLAQRLPPALDASSWQLSAEVVELPVRTASGVRMVLNVYAATSDSAPAQNLHLPIRIQLHVADQPWPDAPETVMARVRQLQAMQVHERWALPVRLRAPRGLMNPHGFDQIMRVGHFSK